MVQKYSFTLYFGQINLVHLSKFHDSNVLKERRIIQNFCWILMKMLQNYLRSKLFINTQKRIQFSVSFWGLRWGLHIWKSILSFMYYSVRFGKSSKLFAILFRRSSFSSSHYFTGQRRVSTEGIFPAVHFKFHQDFVCLLFTFATWLFAFAILVTHFMRGRGGCKCIPNMSSCPMKCCKVYKL